MARGFSRGRLAASLREGWYKTRRLSVPAVLQGYVQHNHCQSGCMIYAYQDSLTAPR